MATDAQKRLKKLRDTIEWADDMFSMAATGSSVDIEGIAAEAVEALEARRADVLCSAKDGTLRCALSKAHTTAPGGPTPHEFT